MNIQVPIFTSKWVSDIDISIISGAILLKMHIVRTNNRQIYFPSILLFFTKNEGINPNFLLLQLKIPYIRGVFFRVSQNVYFFLNLHQSFFFFLQFKNFHKPNSKCDKCFGRQTCARRLKKLGHHQIQIWQRFRDRTYDMFYFKPLWCWLMHAFIEINLRVDSLTCIKYLYSNGLVGKVYCTKQIYYLITEQ